MISAFILDILNNKPVGPILADYLLENHPNNPEVIHYAQNLQGNTLTLQILKDIIVKFGNNKEKKIIGHQLRQQRYQEIHRPRLGGTKQRKHIWQIDEIDLYDYERNYELY